MIFLTPQIPNPFSNWLGSLHDGQSIQRRKGLQKARPTQGLGSLQGCARNQQPQQGGGLYETMGSEHVYFTALPPGWPPWGTSFIPQL